MTKNRLGVGIVLACLVAWGAGCNSEADRAAQVERSSGTQEETTEESRSAWEAFRRTADRDLEAVSRDLKSARKGLAEFEAKQIDRWADRVKRAREEMAREVAGAPEKRRSDREKLKREIEEIKREVAALLAKLGIGKATPPSGEPQE